MILFWLICAVLIVIAFAFILPTALQRDDKSQRTTSDERKRANIAIYRDQLSELEADLQNGIVSQDQYAQDRDEIERRLLEDTVTVTTAKRKTTSARETNRVTAYSLAFTLPLLAIALYFVIGKPNSITDPTGGVTQAPAAATGERSQAQIEANVEALAKRLQSNPSDVQGWTMLARSYYALQRFGEAAGAYAKATELRPDDADLWADYAFVSALANNGRLEGKPMELVNQALKLDPENIKALELAGSAAFMANDHAKAVQYWERVLKKVPPDTELAQVTRERINEAKAAMGNK